MQNSKILSILVVILLIGNIIFGWLYVSSKVTIRNLSTEVATHKVNSEVLLFTQLFVDKILHGSKEVSFEDRLQLENAVRDMNNKEIFDSWQTFTNAKTPTEVQQDFYILFHLLLGKVQS